MGKKTSDSEVTNLIIIKLLINLIDKGDLPNIYYELILDYLNSFNKCPSFLIYYKIIKIFNVPS